MAAISAPASKRVPRYRRHRPIPALVLFLVLGITAAWVWGKVFSTAVNRDAGIRCNPSAGSPGSSLAAPPPLGQPLAPNALDKTEPLPASEVKVRVLNASTQKGQAALVSDGLHDLGFGQLAEPDNDAAYPAGDMNCHGQIRFGPNGAGAARTLSILVPCAELLRDDRQDDAVDLALGKKFTELKPNQAARKVLDQLHTRADQQSALQSDQQAPPNPIAIDSALLASARDVRC